MLLRRKKAEAEQRNGTEEIHTRKQTWSKEVVA